MISWQCGFLQSKAQRVELRALAALVAHLILMVEDELAHGLAICGAARRVAHGVDQQAKLGEVESETLVETHEHDDALGVGCGVGRAQPLDADLVELAQTPLLGTLAAEHRLGVPRLERSGTLRHQVVLHHGADNTRGSLGSQGETLLGLELRIGALREDALEISAGKDAEHLLTDHVGGLADAMHEHVELLDRRGLDGLEPKRPEHLGRDLLHLLPSAHIAPNEVLGALCSLCLHVASPSHIPRRPPGGTSSISPL